jgi:glyoxylase-like metal-dependent hydrolase (beta-lactamase superfamily II)
MEIADGVYSIRQTGRNTYPSGYSHAYLLEDEETGLTLIDTLADTDARLVLEQLRKLGRPVTDLKHIMLTHGHRSHLGGLATLKRLSDAIVYSHEWEADIIAGERKPQPVSLRPIPPLHTYTQRLGLALGIGAPPCRVDQPSLKDGDKVGPVQVIHTPEHTPGHVVFYWPERQALFTGDNIATWPRLDAGWPSFQLNEGQFRTSFRRMAKELDEQVEVIGVAHGEPITRGATEQMRILAKGLSR